MNAQLQPAPSNHPLAGARLTGADIVVQVVADEGVSVVFGIYSGWRDPAYEVYDAVFRYNRDHACVPDSSEPLVHR